MAEKIQSLIPFWLEGPIHWQINVDPNPNILYLSLFNNNGVIRTAQHGDQFVPQLNITGCIKFTRKPLKIDILISSPQEPRMKNILEKKDAGVYNYTISSGGFLVGRIEF